MNKSLEDQNVWRKLGYCTSLFFAITFFLYTPIESYLGNVEEFWFPLWFIALPFSILTFLSFFICAGVIKIISLKYIKVFSLVLFSISFLAYSQRNFLNADYGALGASQIDWSVYTFHFIWDVLFWIIISVFILFLGIKIKKAFIRKSIFALALFLSLIQIITLVIMLFTTPSVAKSAKTILSKEGIYECGSLEGSAIVFILDTMDNQFFKAALKEYPELETTFEGFTYFDNCTGSYTKTAGAVPFIISGKYNNNLSQLSNYFDDAYANSKLLNTLREYDYDIRCYVDSVAGDTTLAQYVDNGADLYVRATNPLPVCKEMMNYVLFRQFPDILKKYFYVDASTFNSLQDSCSITNQYLVDDVAFYEGLLNVRLQKKEDIKTFRLYHLRGSHAPYNLLEDISISTTEATGLTQTVANIKILMEYFKQLKALDIYDSTNILILADHSRWLDGDSIFLAKPAQAAGSMVVSHAAISHEDVHNTLFDMMNLPSVDYGTSAFRASEYQRERIAYLYDEKQLAQYSNYLPPLWEVKYVDGSDIPHYTGKVFSEGKEYSLADLAVVAELGKTYYYDEIRDFFSFGTLSWGDVQDKYIFTNQEAGKLFFKLANIPDSGIKMTIDFLAWMPVSPNTFIVKKEDDILFSQEFTGEMPEHLEIFIDKKYFNSDDNSIILDLSCPNAIRIDDHRKMGFGIYSIQFNENN